MSGSITKGLVRDIGVVGLSNVLVMFSGIILLRTILPELGADNYGYYVQFTVTISLVYTFALLGLPYATVRFLAGCRDRATIRDDVWSTIVIIFCVSLLAGLLILALSGPIAGALFGGNTGIVLTLGLMVPLECMNVTLLNLFRVFQENLKFSVITLVKTYADVAIVIVLISYGYGIMGIFVGLLAARLILFLLLLAYTLLTIGIAWPRFLQMKEYFKFGVPNIPANIASWVSDVSDRYLLGIFKGPTSVGYYNPGYTLGQLVSMFMSPFDFVLVSALSRHYNEGNMGIVHDIFKFSLKFYLLIAIPAAFGLSILSMPLLLILSSSPEVAANSYLVTPFVALSMLLYGVTSITTGKVLFLANRNDLNAIIWIAMAVLNLVINLLLIPPFGVIGAAVATALAYLIGALMSAFFAVRFFRFPVDWAAIAKMIAASAAMAFIVYMLHPVMLPDVILAIAAGFIVYVILVLALGVINKNEIVFMRSMVQRK